MDEDSELNRLFKSALEARAPFAFDPGAARRGGAVRRRILPWASATLLAASVALVAAVYVPGSARSSSVDEVLGLLSEAENLQLAESGPVSSVDLLLAWQEAPVLD